MPELPEVQTVVDSLNNSSIPGKIIESVISPNGYESVCENNSLSDFQNFLQKKQIRKIRRRGKFIILELNAGFLYFHLRMTGRIMQQIENDKEKKYISLQINFTDKSKLFFHDIRKFGRAYISQNLSWLEKRLGIEPLSSELNPHWLYSLFQCHHRMVKSLLLDQKFIVGLGNIYVDEALWQAKIHPKAISSKVSRKKINALCIAIKVILQNAIQHKGTTIINFNYAENKKGHFKDQLKVFGKQNEPCLRCNKIISKIFVMQRGTHYCRKCQKR